MGVFLSAPIREKQNESGENERLAYGASSMQGWRTTMEDAHLSVLDLDDNKTSLFGVFDGHGGKEVSLFSARHLPEALKKSPSFREKSDLGQVLSDCFLGLDVLMQSKEGKRELWEIAGGSKKDVQDNEEENEEALMGPGVCSGSTAVCALIHGDQIYVANVGDSRCVLSRQGKSVDLSIDHKPSDPKELDRIIKAGGFVEHGRVNGDLNLTRALGDMMYKQSKDLPPKSQMITAFPDIQTITREKEDRFLVLACDGVWDVKTSQEVVDFIESRLKRQLELSTICQELLDDCLAPDTLGLGTDNMTVVIVSFKDV